MKDKLEISKENRGHYLLIILDGRVDAHWSGFLSDAVNDEIRNGFYNIVLDFTSVDYLSSDGIRVLVKFYKELKKVNGSFYLSGVSENVRNIIDLVGLQELVKEKEEVIPFQEERKSEIERDGFLFYREADQVTDEITLKLKGKPEQIHSKDFSPSNVKSEFFGGTTFGIGLGAISTNNADALSRMGEFTGLGNAVAYLPTDGTNSPDYSIQAGNLIPEIKYLYGLFFNAGFSDHIRFAAQKSGETIRLSRLIDNLLDLTGFPTLAMVMIAETAGLVGVSLSKSPDKKRDTQLFSFPEVRDEVNFTVEPTHTKMLTVTVGIASRKASETLATFCRPLEKNSAALGHFHTAVFSFHLLKKSNINLSETINGFFEHEHLHNVLHLINDDREVIGTGESEFYYGTCWVGRITSILTE